MTREQIITYGVAVLGGIVTAVGGYIFGGRAKTRRDDFSAVVGAWKELEKVSTERIDALKSAHEHQAERLALLEKTEVECQRRLAAVELELRLKSGEIQRALIALSEVKEKFRSISRPAVLLIVEDEAADVLLMEHSLRQFNAEWKKARTVGEATDLYDRNSFDIILLDLVLGEDSGVKVIEHIRRNNRAVPIIIFTGHDLDSPIVRDARMAGATCAFDKPPTESQLKLMLWSK